jgi:signal transduction histidine kinase
MKNKFELKSVLNILYASVVIIPMIIIGIIAAYYTRNYIIDLSRDYNDQVINNLKLNIEAFFEVPRKDMNLLKDIIEEDSNLLDDEYLESYYDNQTLFHHILIIDSNGKVVNTFPNEEDIIGFDYSRETAVTQLYAGAEDAWSKTYIYTKENIISINYATNVGDYIVLGIIHFDVIEALIDDSIYSKDIIVGVTDQSGMYILHSDMTNVQQRVTDANVVLNDLNYSKVNFGSDEYYGTSVKADYQDWHIVIYEPAEKLNNRLLEFILYITGIIVAMLIVAILVGRRVNHLIVNNLDKVVFNTQEVAEGHYLLDEVDSPFVEFNTINNNFKYMAGEIKSREDQILNQSFEIELMNKELENRVIERTNELYATNQELEIALTNLKTTQDQLIESEKLASLGNLVSGLAHEINTPLGIILTIITYLQETTHKVKEKYDTGHLKKADFETLINSSLESEALIYDNVSRAIELISSFKLISAEQRNIEKRVINIKDFIENILRSLEPQMKKVNIEMRLSCPDDLVFETIPLTFYQILMNLIMNTKIHAYDESGGIVNITVNDEKHHVAIIVEDYGEGIRQENVRKIFEPFFTTKRGSGGTGLGLNIVYNSVKQNLQGNIICNSSEGEGTSFIIELPRNLY